MPVIGNQIIKTGYETYITLAGGRIRCLRCSAKSVRSGLQCAKPAMKSSRTQKCSHHGGWSTGAKTAAGRQRVAQAPPLCAEWPPTCINHYCPHANINLQKLMSNVGLGSSIGVTGGNSKFRRWLGSSSKDQLPELKNGNSRVI